MQVFGYRNSDKDLKLDVKFRHDCWHNTFNHIIYVKNFVHEKEKAAHAALFS